MMGAVSIARRRAEHDSGAVAVIVAVLLIVMLLLVALVVDVGYWYDVRRQLQAGADGAALAGCWELIKSGDKAAALSTARSYAARNAVAPADGATMVEPGEVNHATGHAYTEVTDTYVKVTVRKRAPAFFSMLMGYSGQWIAAQARADAQWLSGMRNVVPWSVPIIAAPTRVTVRVGGGPEQTMTKDGTGIWRGYGIQVGQPPASTGYPLTVTVYNSRGVPTVLQGVAGVVVREATAPFTNVRLDRYVVNSGDAAGIDVFVASVDRPTSATFGGRKYAAADFTGSAGDWRLHMDSPSVSDLTVTYPLDIEFGQGNAKYQLTNAAYVVVRRSTYPMKSVFASPHTVGGAASTIDVDLELNEYEYGRLYELKVTAGAEIGNFCAIDLGAIYHPPSFGPPSTPEYDLRTDPSYQAPAYYHYLAQALPFELHLGDIVWTEPGNLSGPQTNGALNDRFAGDTYTWSSWNAATPPRPPTKRLVYVPVVENAETVNGRTALVVVGITAFFIEPAPNYRDTIRGYFVKYVAGGQGTPDPPPNGWGIQTPRLVPTQVDF